MQIEVKSQRRHRKKMNRSVCFSRSMLRYDSDDIEVVKISVKKEMERNAKLKKLLQRYNAMTAEDKAHVKNIKAALIQVRDHPKIEKPRIHADPGLYVENTIKLQIREYLFTLLNTFYKAYEDNQTNSQAAVVIKDNLTYLIKQISFEQDKVYYLQKNQINMQVHAEGELCSQKNRLKDKLIEKKGIDDHYTMVSSQFEQQQQIYQQEMQTLKQLQEKVVQLQVEGQNLDRDYLEKQLLRKQYHGQVAIELLYQEKMNCEIKAIELKIDEQERLRKKYLETISSRKVKEGEVARHSIDHKLVSRSDNFQFVDMAKGNNNKECEKMSLSQSANIWNVSPLSKTGNHSHLGNQKNYCLGPLTSTTQTAFLSYQSLLETSETHSAWPHSNKLRN